MSRFQSEIFILIKAKIMKVHYVKCLPEFFKLIVNGKKRFEIRYDDRKYQIGDLVILREYENGVYSKEKICKTIEAIPRARPRK